MDTTEVVERVHQIMPMLIADIRAAIRSHAALEANNAIISKGLKGLQSEYFYTYNSIQNALTLKLAMDIARIFDISDTRRRSAEKQGKSSIPVLEVLLSKITVQAQPEIKDHTHPVLSTAVVKATAGVNRPRIDRKDAAARFLELAATVTIEGSDEKSALRRVRDFRNSRLAHSLFDKSLAAPPIYADLDLLLSTAMRAASLACLAVDGVNIDFDERAKLDRQNAEGYARYVLEGLRQSATPAPRSTGGTESG
jgi:hypothetical protein